MRKSSCLTVMAMTIALLSGCAQFRGSPPPCPDMKKTSEHPAQENTSPPAVSSTPKETQEQADRRLPGSRKPLLFQESPAEATLKFAQNFSSMSAENQKEEIARLGKKKNELSRLQMALALSHPASRFRDLPRALALLEEKILDDSLRPLANLLKSLLLDQQRSDELQQQSAQRIKEEQRRADALQQKLDDLMNLEKSMIRSRPK